MKNKLIDLFKGFLLGLNLTIPGFSTGTFAIFLNIYERLIDAFSKIVKEPLKAIKGIGFIILGFIVGLGVNIFTITFLLEYFPFQTSMFFVGLVIVFIPYTYKQNIKNKLNYKDIISFVILLVIMVVVTLLNATQPKEISLDIVFIILLFVMGIIGASTMIIPGISGSLILLALGFYDPVLNIIKNVLKSILTLNFDNFLTNIICFVVFFIGAILGVILVSKGIKGLLNKFYQITFSGILGLLVASPFSIIYLTLKDNVINFNIVLIIVSVITFILGGVTAYFLNKLDEKNSNS